MIEAIKGWIINIVIVIILLSFLEILMPDSKMKKYINLILGFIVMLVILGPIIEVLNSTDNLQDDVFIISSELNKKEYSFVSSNIENKQMNQLKALYKDRIRKDIAYRVESKYNVKVGKVNIEIEEDNQERNGGIKSLELYVLSSEEPRNEDTIPIVKIDVSDNEKNNIEKNTNKSLDKDINIDLSRRIKEDISNIYNLNETSIEIRH
ncbi:MAG: stage III sporulation protein AF [Clostridia bacterium]|nr:stage III sporulation protein AF [Clostridia bacterium]